VPFTYLDLRLQPDAIEGSLVAHIFDVGHDLKIDPAERLLQPEYAASQAASIIALLAPRLTVTADGRTLAPQWSQLEVLADRQSLRVHVRYGLASPPAAVTVSALMFPYDPNHQTFVNIDERDAITQAILDSGRTRLEYVSGTRQGVLLVVRRFALAGAEHMVIGPEHLLFLLGLMLLGGTIRQFVAIVTAFTVAHTATMALAVFNIVASPSRIVEPAIALSLVYVGADNLLIHGGRDVRAWIAAAFGVIHGLGYANVLRDVNLQPTALRWSLVAFNAGAEAGQLLVVLVLASALAALRSRSEVAGRRLAFAGSLVVIVAGAVLFIQRVFFPGGV
jgi:HupE / UreJ protein